MLQLLARKSRFRLRRGNTLVVLTLSVVCLLIFWLCLRTYKYDPNQHDPHEANCQHVQDNQHLASMGAAIPVKDDLPDQSELLGINATEMSAAVKEMTRFAWRSYADNCGRPHGGNELAPLTRSCSPASDHLVGPRQLLTAVDALDTLALMELRDELDEARQLVTGGRRAKLSNVSVSVFETCIRLLGGYLGAYSLTEDSKLLAEAVAVADSLAGAFRNPETLASSHLWLSENSSSPKLTTADEEEIVLSEAGSLYLEFTYLSHATGNKKYEKWVTHNQKLLMLTPSVRGVYPSVMGPRGEPLPQRAGYSAGAFSDSFYEYLLKMCQYIKEPDEKCTKDYTVALDAIMNHLTVRVGQNNRHPCVVTVKYPCAQQHRTVLPCTMEHLTCFLGGTYALAYLMNPHRTDWLRFAEDVTHTCYLSYFHSPTGLGPEIFTFDTKTAKFTAEPGNDDYILRPETVESIYYLHYVTGHKKYRYWGRKILLAINNSARTSRGFSGITQMLMNKTALDNTQQSFFLAETLKYLYLLFQPNSRLRLDQWMLTTEAHVLPTAANPMRNRMHG